MMSKMFRNWSFRIVSRLLKFLVDEVVFCMVVDVKFCMKRYIISIVISWMVVVNIDFK